MTPHVGFGVGERGQGLARLINRKLFSQFAKLMKKVASQFSHTGRAKRVLSRPAPFPSRRRVRRGVGLFVLISLDLFPARLSSSS